MPSPHPSIVKALELYAHTQPNKPAFIFHNQTSERLVLTRQRVWDCCRKFACVLKRKGLEKSHVVCNTLRNSPQRIITQLGTITAGAISMNGQICFADGSDFISSLCQGQASAIILDPNDTKGAFSVLKPRLDHYDINSGEVVCSDVPSLKYILSYPSQKKEIKPTQSTISISNHSRMCKHVPSHVTSDYCGRHNMNSFLEDLENEKGMVHEDISPDDVCQYMCTSGTTNMFKLVAFSSHAIMEYGLTFSRNFGANDNDIYMNNRLLGWGGGYPSVYLATGITRVIFDESNGRPSNHSQCQWELACREKCTVCFCKPQEFVEFNTARIGSLDEDVRKHKLRTILSGGGPINKKQMVAALGNLAEEVVVVYGSTEAGSMCSLPVRELGDYGEFNVGRPALDVRVKVVDGDGAVVPIGQRGKVLVQSSQSALYYVDDPDKTSRTFQTDGWIRLGDLGMLNARGQLSVVGRDKFAILRGTLVLYPDVIESFIRQCPGVKEVAITGVPDEKYHEEICAMIIRTPGEAVSAENIKQFCESRLADRAMVSPVPAHFLFLESFPVNVIGKLDRNLIRRQACHMLNLMPR